MFGHNIGVSIKAISVALFVLALLASVIFGVVLLSNGSGSTGLGLLIVFGGPVLAWLGCAFIYAFGELLDRTIELTEATVDVLDTTTKILRLIENNAPSDSENA